MRAALAPIIVLTCALGCSSSSSSGGGGDGGSADSGADSAAADSGGADSGATVQGCGAADFVDKTGVPATISFPMDFTPVQYAPPCVKIKVGQMVTWSGNFTDHPLEAMNGDSGNPITPTNTGMIVMFTFSKAGTFGFDCANHPSIMKGAILVVP